jgi:type VI secretion system lysozyme-like protein
MALPKPKSQKVFTMAAPLFDRLRDENPKVQEEVEPFNTYTMSETVRSIGQELFHMLNTRTSQIPYSIYATREDLMDTDLNHHYGLPDFASFDVVESMAAQKLARQIRRVVEHYECRLSNVGVRLVGLDENEKLIVEISGIVYLDPYHERHTFPIEITRSNGTS